MITYINTEAIEDQSIDWSKLKNVPEFSTDDSITPMVNVTYAELKDLRDNSELVPGQQYRITDYVTTTTQYNTQSDHRQFDIIVIADDESTLNEKARAIQHEGDTYFANQNLSAWELWYCLDNDAERFAWAQPTESESEAFLQLIKPASGVSASGIYKYNAPISKIVFNGATYNPEIGVRTMINSGPPVYIIKHDERTLVVEDASGYVVSSGIYVYGIVYAGRGVIYRMIDEYCNDCPYDFKNIMFRHPKDTVTYPDYYYTFTIINSGLVGAAVGDYSLGIFCRNNTIKNYYPTVDGIVNATLNNIVFINTSFIGCYNNSFGDDCNNNSFGNNCYDNSFGNNCYDNSFGNYCYKNTFGDSCNNNSFGNNCSYNSFGNYCYKNTFSDHCNWNSFCNDCHDNDFGDDCYDNYLGTGFYNKSFGDNISNVAYFKDKVYAPGGFYEE